jgi:hypothetical protein
MAKRKSHKIVEIKSLTVNEFETLLQVPIAELTVEQMQSLEQMWRTLWGWTDDTVKRFLFRIGTTIRLMRRDYKGNIGELGQVKFEPIQLEIATYEKSYNMTDGKYYYERKVVIYPYTTIGWIEEVIEQRPAEEVEIPSLDNIPEETAV